MFVAVDEDFPEHPKTLRFCALLGNPLAWGHVVLLWRWCMRYAKDGDLSRFTAEEIEAAMLWRGPSADAFDALIKAGFVDESPRCVHDWMDHMGKWVEKAESDRKRKVAARLRDKKRPSDVRRTARGRRADGAGTSPLLSSPLPTLPDQTRSDSLEPGGPDSQPPPVMTFPVVGDVAKPAWDLPRQTLVELRAAFPTVDVIGECRKALAWIQANPGKRKTARGMRAFLTRWLSTATDTPRQRAAPPGQPKQGRTCNFHEGGFRPGQPAPTPLWSCLECERIAHRVRSNDGTPTRVGEIA